MSSEEPDLATHPGIRWSTVADTGPASDVRTPDGERREGCKRIWSLAEARARRMGARALDGLEVDTADGTLVLVRDGSSIAAAAVDNGSATAIIRYELRRALRVRHAKT